MRTIEDYISAAVQRHDLTQNGLARELDLTSAAVVQMRKGKSVPKDKTMLHLAQLAGIDSTEALCDLSRWRAKDPDVKAAWSKLAKLAGVATVAGMISGGPGAPPANAVPLGTGSYLQGALPKKGPEQTAYRVTSDGHILYIMDVFARLTLWLLAHLSPLAKIRLSLRVAA